MAGAGGASPGVTRPPPITRARAFSHGRQVSSVSSIPGFWATLYQPGVNTSKPLPPFPPSTLDESHKLVEWSEPASMPVNGIRQEIDLLDSGTELRNAGVRLLTYEQMIMTRLTISMLSSLILRLCPPSARPPKHSKLTRNSSIMKSKTSTISKPFPMQNVSNVSRLPRRSWQSCSKGSMALENEHCRQRRISPR